MTNKQYEKLKQAIQTKFDIGVALLEEKRVSDIQALDTVHGMVDALRLHDNIYGSVTKNVIRVVENKEVPDVFDKRDVIRAFGCVVSMNTLDSALWRLARRNFLIVIEKGIGSRPSRYKLNKTKIDETSKKAFEITKNVKTPIHKAFTP